MSARAWCADCGQPLNAHGTCDYAEMDGLAGVDHVTGVPMTVTTLPPTIKAAGDPRPKEATWTLMPIDTRNGGCSQCGIVHEPDQPHDNQSLPYQYSFYAEHDRWPTWADAMAHCTPEVQEQWTTALRSRGVEVGNA